MKKLFALIMSVMMLMTVFSVFTVSANTEQDNTIKGNIISETTEYFSDGSSATVIVTDESGVLTRATTYTKTGSKYYILRNKNGAELWRFTVHGTFSVNPGVSSTCTGVSHSISITEDAWQNKSASTSRSGNQAIGDATFIKKLLFITTETKSCHVILTCDANGKLS